MSENNFNPEMSPLVISFEMQIPANKLSEIVALLGEVCIGDVRMSLRANAPEALLEAEEKIPDVAFGRKDVFRVAEKNEISRVVAGRTMGVLERLSKPSLWGDRILLPQGGYSSKALRDAISRGDLEAVIGMGPMACELVSLVIADVEAQKYSSSAENNLS